MLLIKTKLLPSKIAGIGLFTDQFIAQGTCIWRFKKDFDVRVGPEYPDTLPETAKDYFSRYAYQNPKTKNYVLCSDDARFFNHSDTPNTICVEDPDDEDTMNVATRDIQIGEELTIDYREFDTDPFHGFSN